ncbi:hypothetical protein [Winogradskyella sp. A2]|uniref:hypothetical protein n=1 Tax=Winogradskyella sp. A2 TaxID=3366944 RepID=UPI00398C4623
MKKILKLLIVGCLVLTYSCEEDKDTLTPNYIAFGVDEITETVDVGEGSKTIEVNVYTGNKTGSDRTFSLTTENSTADAAAYSAPSSVVIEAGSNSAMVEVTVFEAGLTFDFSEILLEFSPTTDIDTIAETAVVSINAALLCPPATAGNVTIEIDTDNWPDETSWAVTDSSGAVVASGGPYNNPADDFTTIVVNVTLGAGSYTMTLNDSYGDGGSTFRVINGCGQVLATDSVGASTVSGGFTI